MAANRSMRVVILLSLLTLASHGNAGEVYKCKTEQGVTFSNKPCAANAEAVRFKSDKTAKQVSSSNDVGLENTSCTAASTYHGAAAGNVVNRTGKVQTATVVATFYRGGNVIDTTQSTVVLAPWDKKAWRLIGGTYGNHPPDECRYSVSWK